MQKKSQFSQDHPVAMITGGNSGIGFATATKLAQHGFHVILASRNQKTSAQAIAQIRESYPHASLESIPLDLSSFTSVRQCAAAFQEKGYPLHVLINNAGGSVPGEQASFSADGFELTLATNHLGHFLLTNLLARRPGPICSIQGDHCFVSAACARIWNGTSPRLRLRQSGREKVLQCQGVL